MDWRRIFWFGRVEYRLLAVGAYSFAAFSVAALVQILSSGNVRPEMHPQLAKIAFAALPLLAAGMALDFYCVDRPRMRVVASVIALAIGMLGGTAVNAFIVVIGVYSPRSGELIEIGMWVALAIIAATYLAAVLLDRDPADAVRASPEAVR